MPQQDITLELGFQLSAVNVRGKEQANSNLFLKDLSRFHESTKLCTQHLFGDFDASDSVKLTDLSFETREVLDYVRTDFVYDFTIINDITANTSIQISDIVKLRVLKYLRDFKEGKKAYNQLLCLNLLPVSSYLILE